MIEIRNIAGFIDQSGDIAAARASLPQGPSIGPAHRHQLGFGGEPGRLARALVAEVAGPAHLVGVVLGRAVNDHVLVPQHRAHLDLAGRAVARRHLFLRDVEVPGFAVADLLLQAMGEDLAGSVAAANHLQGPVLDGGVDEGNPGGRL